MIIMMDPHKAVDGIVQVHLLNHLPFNSIFPSSIILLTPTPLYLYPSFPSVHLLFAHTSHLPQPLSLYSPEHSD